MTTGTQLSVQSVRVDPHQLPAGQESTATGRITLTGLAPAEGVDVNVFTDQSEVISVPHLVHVPADESSATFAIKVQSVSTQLAADITAFLGDQDKQNDTLQIGTAEVASTPN